MRAAERRIAGAVVRTELLPARALGERLGVDLYLKAEHRQRTGSFKARGALNRILQLSRAARARGVITISAGNHAAALAWAAARAGVDATVVMPEGAARAKVATCERYGARVVLHGDVFAAFQLCLEIRDRERRTLVHPFDDPEILHGQGTVALEILEQLPSVATVIVPVGGGGLIAGIAGTLAGVAAGVQVFGVEPEGAAAMTRSLEAGLACRLERVDTVADGLGAPMAGELPFPIVRDHVRALCTVTDDGIVEALRALLVDEKQVVEPAGAAGVAALLAGHLEVDPDRPVAVVLSGGNIGAERLVDLLATRPASGTL